MSPTRRRGHQRLEGWYGQFIAITMPFLMLLLLFMLIGTSPVAHSQSLPPKGVNSRELFARRILPFFRSKKSSTCSECHLSGVDIKDYIQPTEQGTFASLRDQGLIDLKKPEASHILRLIRMSTPKTPLLTQKARDLEYTAFRDWIVAATHDPKMKRLPKTSTEQQARPKTPDAVLRHTRLDSLLLSFTRNVYSQEGRCMGCHRAGTSENDANVKKYGKRVAWFVPDSPEETMQRVLLQKLVNVNDPEKSLLLLKPLNRVPHGGGVKFVYGDGGYKLFRAWIEDYAKSVRGTYASVKSLPSSPEEELTYSESILNVKSAPSSWANCLLRVDVYAWEKARNAWSRRPIATGDRQVGANGETNVLMFLLQSVHKGAKPTTDKTPVLIQGRYLLKYYVDTEGKLGQNYAIPTDSSTFYKGQQEITAEWGRGWGKLTQVSVNSKE